MNLKPKRLGDELSLDDYNACQYLLYSMDCWNDNVFLNTYVPKTGKFATYKLMDNSILETEKQEHYRILRTPTANDIFNIELLNIDSSIGKLHLSPKITIYYKEPEPFCDGEGNEVQLDVTDYREIDIWGADEAKETEYLETHYKKLIVNGTYNPDTNIISFNLFDEKNKTIVAESIISKRIIISYDLDSEPYIDFRNGKANFSDEILVDNVPELVKLIKNVPNNNQLVIFRLDSNIDSEIPPNAKYTEKVGTYFLTKPITIKAGQNIEIRGGTRAKARINASLSKRCFIINPEAHLTLTNITCEYGAARYSNYDSGRGGAILLEYGYNTFGILDCDKCTFENNAADYGGAIFSYHTGLHINGSTFTNNTALFKGGAIYYQAFDVKMTVENVLTKVGAVATFKAEVKTISGTKVNEGDVDFYIRKNGKDVHIGTNRVRHGVVDVTYTIPSEVKTIEYPIIAVYNGGRGIDNETATATVKIKVPERYTISWVSGTVTKAKVGDIITLNAKVVGNGGVLSTTPVLSYRIGNNVYEAQKNGNMYSLTYKVSKDDVNPDDNTLSISIYAIANDDYTSNTLTTKFEVDVTEDKTIDGYMTGLFVNGSTPITETMVQGWIDNGITDVYVRYKYVKNETTTNAGRLETIMKKDKFKGKVRFHVAINCLYDTSEQKWYSATDSGRISTIKEEIKSIKDKFTTAVGINLDYVRYSGGKNSDSADTRVKQVNSVYKTLNEYIKSLNKNYIISTSVKAEDDANKSYYGQDLKAILDYVDYIQPMIYKADYASWSNYEDSWVTKRIEYIRDLGVPVEKMMVALQGYKMSNGKYPTLNIDEFTTTVQKCGAYKVKGVAIFREGLHPISSDKKKQYVTKSLNSFMEESKK